jgi:cytochrome c556
MISRFFFFSVVTLILSIARVSAAEPVDEKQFQKLMKEVGDVGKRFRSGVESKNSEQVSKDANRAAEIHKQLVAFWHDRKAADAVKWSEETSKAATMLATAAKVGDWEKAKTELQNYGKSCKGCHDAYREKLDDGSYRIKSK